MTTPQASTGEHGPAGNVYDKYRTRNPVARWLMQGFLRCFDDLSAAARRGAAVLEAGCGEGELSIRLAARGHPVRAFDVSDDIVEEARRRAASAGAAIDLSTRSILDLVPGKDDADLVVCCEVLEHLDDPDAALARLASIVRPGGHVLLSVPREPLWRVLNMARGKYLRHWGNTPGHVQHWSRDAFLTLVRRHLPIVTVRSPVPWTFVLAQRPQGL